MPYFLELARYIHLNSLRAGLYADCAELDRYAWSGHAALLGNGSMTGQEVDAVLERFNQNRTQAWADIDNLLPTALPRDAGTNWSTGA